MRARQTRVQAAVTPSAACISFFRTRAALFLIVIAAACNRHELVRPTCPPDEPPKGRSSIGWYALSVDPRNDSIPAGISGIVLDLRTLKPLAGTTVTLDSTNFGVRTDTAGRFELLSIPPRSYSIRVRRIGYRAAREAVEYFPQQRIRIVALLELDWARLDGECGLILIRQKKPRWKW